MKKLLVILFSLVLVSCGNKEYKSAMDLPDNIYESIVLSFPDASNDEVFDLYQIYSEQLDTLSEDEVILINKN